MAEPDRPQPTVHQIWLKPAGACFQVGPDQTVLQAAAQAGWRLPSSCRNGTCRACLCQMRSGQVRYLVEWPGLSADERAEGWILPCVAVAEGDIEIFVEQAAPLWG